MKLTQGTQGTQGIPGSSRKVQPATEEFGIVGMGVRQGAFVTPEVVRSMVSKASGGGAVESCVKGGFHVEGVESSIFGCFWGAQCEEGGGTHGSGEIRTWWRGIFGHYGTVQCGKCA